MATLIAVRSNRGIEFIHGPQTEGTFDDFERDGSKDCKEMIFSNDGHYFAWSNGKQVSVVATTDFKPVCQIEKPRVTCLDFSPKGTYLATWQPYTVSKESTNPLDNCNLHIFDVIKGTCLKSFIQKKQSCWKPQWSDDESVCSRSVNNEVHFFANGDFSTIAKKIYMTKVASYSLSPGSAPYNVACYVPGVKGQPNFVRMFVYPKFEGASAVLAQRSFYKSDKVDYFWNKTGKDLIFQTTVDVDKSNSSYYGEQALYYFSAKGETGKVLLKKEGPIYSFNWSPNGTEFCVVYGFMPAHATLYNLKCDPVFSFGSGPRNDVIYAPLANKLILYGFGNLRGNIEVWDLKDKKQISKFIASDSTYISWSPDGEHILTATTTPRLRIGNGYRVWHYTGSLQKEVSLADEDELYDLKWKPFPEGSFTVKNSRYVPVPGIESFLPAACQQAYRPPCARGQPSTFKIHEYEKPSIPGQAQNGLPDKVLTKNQKKSLAKKNKKEREKSIPVTSQIVNSADEVDKTPALQASSIVAAEGPDKEKIIRKTVKKLDQIDKLKQELQSGKQLNVDQIQKIGKEDELREELKKLRL